MDNDIELRVKDRLAKDLDFNFDRFFADAWKIFKKVTLIVAGITVILAICMIVVYSIILFFMLGPAFIDQLRYAIRYKSFHGRYMFMQTPLFLIIQNLVGIIFAALLAPINAGILKICRDADKTGVVNFGTVFTYYKGPFLLKIMIAAIIIAAISNSLNFLFNFIPIIGPLMYWGVALCIYIFMVFVQPLIIFGNAELGKSFSLSIKITGKAFLPILGYSFLFWLISAAGAVACCIGVFFTVAFVPVSIYLLYKYTIGFPEDEVAVEEQPHWQNQPPMV